MAGIPFDCGRRYRYPREVWRPTRVESRCAFGPEAALPARTSDPAEDLRPRPRRHTVPANEMLVRLSRYANRPVVLSRSFFARRAKYNVRILSRRTIIARIKLKNIRERERYLKFKFYREQNCSSRIVTFLSANI